MKKYLSVLLLAISIVVFGQGKMFYTNNKQVVWENIFKTDKSIQEIKSILLSSGKVKFNSDTESSATGELNDFVMDFKGAGYTLMSTPNYLDTSSKFYATFKIKTKEGRYRVTVTNIRFKGNKMSLYSGGFGISNSGENNIEDFVLKNDRETFKGGFTGRESKIIDYSFTNLFDISKYQTNSNDNW
ncbi:hypothetical protein [Elizabethkingia meningoseptica]|uniref:hypothetical protein n=1 Tax=Elizabethkingia meningoseptica TaxID=238 RepID=UPI0013658D04|nr:hypothetical protein [Elizabethkingia meningoseptica]MDE5489397.1 hypothetical protein [Elizabethkingia meningoseptica]MEC4712072.1 hypothetical protein [Elizabethkingia meningoseptica]MVW91737.1 hypothetical protein [Elizabethkingia meningoseptica]